MTDKGTIPAGFGGAMTVRYRSSVTFSPVPDIPLNLTSVTPENPVPVMVTTVPPAVDPEVGEIPASSGSGNSYRYMADGPWEIPAPAAFLMEIGTDPGEDAGVMAVIWLSSITFTIHA